MANYCAACVETEKCHLTLDTLMGDARTSAPLLLIKEETEFVCKHCQHELEKHSNEDRTRRDGRSRDGDAAQAPATAIDTRKAFIVRATLQNAKNALGARGNVYKLCEKHFAFYCGDIEITYKNRDLDVVVYFRDENNAMAFQNSLNDWKYHLDLTKMTSVYVQRNPEEVRAPEDLTRICFSDYEPSDCESPCESLNHLLSFRLSVPLTEDMEVTDDLQKYQCLENLPYGANAYSCHIKDKAKFKDLVSNKNNLLVGTWTPFHQFFDGLRTCENIPLIALSIHGTSANRSAANDNRFQVILKVEFFEERICGAFDWKMGFVPPTDKCQFGLATVFVEDQEIFCDAIAWKHADTMRKWGDHRAFLDDA